MNPGFTVEVTNLSPKATEKNVYDFFSFSGQIEHVEILRHGEYSSTAYVTFKDAHALDTACLLSGASIADQPVCITRWGDYDDRSYGLWASSPWEVSHDEGESFAPSSVIGDTAAMAKGILSTGFVLGCGAAVKAKEFDESLGVSASAAAAAAELSERIGLNEKFSLGVEMVRAADEEFRLSETTKAAVLATGKTAAAVASAVVNSSYFSAGASLISDALTMAANAVAGLGGRHE